MEKQIRQSHVFWIAFILSTLVEKLQRRPNLIIICWFGIAQGHQSIQLQDVYLCAFVKDEMTQPFGLTSWDISALVKKSFIVGIHWIFHQDCNLQVVAVLRDDSFNQANCRAPFLIWNFFFLMFWGFFQDLTRDQLLLNMYTYLCSSQENRNPNNLLICWWLASWSFTLIVTGIM